MSALETAKKYVPEMRKVADVVVVTYHGGFECGPFMWRTNRTVNRRNEGYAIVTQVEENRCVSDRTPTPCDCTKVNGMPVIQPGYRGAYVRNQLRVEKVDGKSIQLFQAKQTSPN